MRLWRRRILAAVAGFLALASVAPASATSLKDAIDTALSFRPDLQRQGALVEVARAAIDAALAAYLPHLDIQLDSGWQYSETPTTRAGDGPAGVNQWHNEASFEGSQLIFDGFGTPYRIDAARARLTQSEWARREVVEQIAVEAVQAYLDVQRNQAFVAIADKNLQAHRRLLQQVRVQAAAGQVTDADVAQAVARAALAEAMLAERLGALASAVATYVETIGGPPEGLQEQDAPQRLRPASEAEAIETALAGHPSLATGRAAVAASDAEVGAASSTYWPTLSARAQGTAFDDIDGIDGQGASVEGGVDLRWNLYNGGGDQAAIDQARSQLAASGYDLDDAARKVREDVSVAYRTLLAAEAMLPPLKDHAAAARQVFAGYRQQFDIGRRSLLDLLDAQSELFNAELRATDARFRLVLANYQLLFAMGSLTAGLGIAPPE